MKAEKARVMRHICTSTMVIAVVLTACGSGDLTLNQADPDIVAQKPTWAHVEPIIQRECVPCHTGRDETPNNDDNEGDDDLRLGDARNKPTAPMGEDPGLESCLSVVANLEDVIESIFEKNDMPPGAWPRLDSKEQLTIRRWINANPVPSCE